MTIDFRFVRLTQFSIYESFLMQCAMSISTISSFWFFLINHIHIGYFITPSVLKNITVYVVLVVGRGLWFLAPLIFQLYHGGLALLVGETRRKPPSCRN